MIVGIETEPQLQPAACSFLGHDKNTAEWFVRLVSPVDVFSDTLLMSNVAFNEIAKAVGYIDKRVAYQAVEDLSRKIDDVLVNLDAATAELSRLRNAHNSSVSLEETFDRLRSELETCRSSLGGSKKSQRSNKESDADASDSDK